MKKQVQWAKIEKRLNELGMQVTIHSLKQRLNIMYDQFKANEATSQRASGVDEDSSEKDQLIMDYHERIVDFMNAQMTKKQAADLQLEENAEGGTLEVCGSQLALV